MIDRIKPMGFDDDAPINMLLYGRSGTGKTTFWATAPGPILAVICSGSPRRADELRSVDTPENRDKISEVVLEESRELLEVARWAEAEKAFRTIVVDHVSGFQDLVLKEILGVEELPVQKSWGMADQQQYGACTEQCKEAFVRLLNLDANVVFIAHERRFGDDADAASLAPTIGAALMPKLAQWMNGAVNYVCQTFIRQKVEAREFWQGQGAKRRKIVREVAVPGQIEYCLRTGPQEPTYMTKFRMPTRSFSLPLAITDPDWDKVTALIRAGFGEEPATE